MYGFRRSPRLWGEHRDETLEQFVIEVQEEKEGKEKKKKLQLLASASEPNLWRIVPFSEDQEEEELELMGLVMTYVDDIFIAGSSQVVEAVTQKIQTWTTSTPDQINSTPVKFLGMEVSREMNPTTGRSRWILTQQSYLTDLLSPEAERLRGRKTPITRDYALMPDDEEEPKLEEIRPAQKVVGEVLWLVTRTMFAASRMGASVLQGPQAVKTAAHRLKEYLWLTRDQGLIYEEEENEITIQVTPTPPTPRTLKRRTDARSRKSAHPRSVIARENIWLQTLERRLRLPPGLKT